MILKVFSNLNDSIILLLFAIKEPLKMHSFCKRAFAAQDTWMLACGYRFGGTGGSVLWPGEAARAVGAGGGNSAFRGAGGPGTPQQPWAGAHPYPFISKSQVWVFELFSVPKPMPCPKPRDSGCTGGSRDLPIFSPNPFHIQSLFLLHTNSIFQFKGKKAHPNPQPILGPARVSTHWRNLQHHAGVHCRLEGFVPLGLYQH